MPKCPQGPPLPIQPRGITGSPNTTHPRTSTMQPKAYHRDLQPPPGNWHAGQGYDRDSPPPEHSLHCGPGVQWGRRLLGTLPCVWGVQWRLLLPTPPTCGQALGDCELEDSVITDGPLGGLEGDGRQPPQLSQLSVDPES